MSVARPLFDGLGAAVQLGALLGKGGEGSIYDLAGDTTRVAKVYHDANRINVEKLMAMVRLSNPSLGKISAWPERTLHDRRGGRVVGFVMPRADGTNLSDLLGPGSRKLQFPDATYLFVVRAAVNLAKAFATTHATGSVIGDVKEVNELVNRQAIVTLVDTDGFQIRDPQTGKVFSTLAVTPTHQPPELQGLTDFSRVLRTPDHDAFGLAVLIFQLLFMGRHPFTGVPVARKDLEIPEAIKQLQFSWAPNLPHRLYAQPPATLSLGAVGPLGTLFIRAFLPGQSGGRPSSEEWARVLTSYEQQLRKCAANPAHAHLPQGGCPLCQIETQTSTLLFLGPMPAGAGGVIFDLNAIWAHIASVASPGQAPALPSPPVRAPIPAAAALGGVRRRQKRTAGAVLVAGSAVTFAATAAVGPSASWGLLVVVVIAWIVWAQGTSDAAVYLNARQVSRKKFDDLRNRWQLEAGEARFKEKAKTLEAARDALRKLDAEKALRLQGLRTNARQHQLERYLRAQRIAQARIPNIGAGRITTLRSYSIETAYDVTPAKLTYIHGFGPKLQGNLYAWRQQLEQRFHFDPARGVDPRDLQDLEREFAAKRAQYEQMLRLGPMALRQLVEEVQRRRQELAPQMQAALADLAQAEANAKVAA